MEHTCYMGIDPGKVGFIAIQYNGEFKHFSIADNDLYQLSDLFATIKEKHPTIVCCMEQIHAIYGSSASATFSFGEIFGVLQGLLIANKIPYHLVQPKIWQKEMWDNKDIEVHYKRVTPPKDNPYKEIKMRKVTDTKATSINAARRLFPTIDFRRTERCSKIDDNKVDATLICEYARRKNL